MIRVRVLPRPALEIGLGDRIGAPNADSPFESREVKGRHFLLIIEGNISSIDFHTPVIIHIRGENERFGFTNPQENFIFTLPSPLPYYTSNEVSVITTGHEQRIE